MKATKMWETNAGERNSDVNLALAIAMAFFRRKGGRLRDSLSADSTVFAAI